ncbi:MAG: hypothetical protein H6672_01770 [Anaerolineaceae bacterium]|nr:hypothetical protein [Anaerolineaceae bacterium]
MLPDRAAPLYTAPLDDLLTLLLRQFKRLLAEKGVEMDDAAIKTTAEAACKQVFSGEHIPALREALVALVTESEGVLARWNLTFPQALDTSMNAIPGWESTSEFLEIANEKANAELRIAAGGTLLVALGDNRYVAYLLAAIDYAPDEVETIIAKRVLLSISGINGDVADWRTQLGEWVKHHHA